MGPFLQQWLSDVKANVRSLQWTQQRIEYQLVLINSVNKSSRLLRALGKVSIFQRGGKPILGKSSDRIPTGAGKSGRAGQLHRLLAFVATEGSISITPREEDSMKMDDCFWRSMTTDEIAAGGSKTAIVRKSAASQGKEAARGKGKEAAESESEEHAEGGKEVDIGAHVVDHGADTTMNELAQCSLMTPPEAAVKKRQSKSRTSTVDMFETPATCTRPSSSSGVTGAQGEEEGQGRSQKAGVEQGVRGGRGKGMKRAREPRESDGRGGSNKERRGERGGGKEETRETRAELGIGVLPVEPSGFSDDDGDLLRDAFRERAFGPAHNQSATRTAAHMGPESDGTTTTRQGNRASTREKRVPRR